jgi:hypothetical protein
MTDTPAVQDLSPGLKRPCPQCSGHQIVLVRHLHQQIEHYQVRCLTCGFRCSRALTLMAALSFWQRLFGGPRGIPG